MWGELFREVFDCVLVDFFVEERRGFLFEDSSRKPSFVCMLVFEMPNILVMKMFKCFGRPQKVRLLQKNKIRQVFVEIGIQIFKFFLPFRGKSIRVPREERKRKRGGPFLISRSACAWFEYQVVRFSDPFGDQHSQL